MLLFLLLSPSDNRFSSDLLEGIFERLPERLGTFFDPFPGLFRTLLSPIPDLLGALLGFLPRFLRVLLDATQRFFGFGLGLVPGTLFRMGGGVDAECQQGK